MELRSHGFILGPGPVGWLYADYPATPTATQLWPTNGRGGVSSDSSLCLYGPNSPVALGGLLCLAAPDAAQTFAIRSFTGGSTYFAPAFNTAFPLGDFLPAQSLRSATFSAGIDPIIDAGSGAFAGAGVLLIDGMSFQVVGAGTSLLQVRVFFYPVAKY